MDQDQWCFPLVVWICASFVFNRMVISFNVQITQLKPFFLRCFINRWSFPFAVFRTHEDALASVYTTNVMRSHAFLTASGCAFSDQIANILDCLCIYRCPRMNCKKLEMNLDISSQNTYSNKVVIVYTFNVKSGLWNCRGLRNIVWVVWVFFLINTFSLFTLTSTK